MLIVLERMPVFGVGCGYHVWGGCGLWRLLVSSDVGVLGICGCMMGEESGCLSADIHDSRACVVRILRVALFEIGNGTRALFDDCGMCGILNSVGTKISPGSVALQHCV
jgi:hypothetical protein